MPGPYPRSGRAGPASTTRGVSADRSGEAMTGGDGPGAAHQADEPAEALTPRGTNVPVAGPPASGGVERRPKRILVATAILLVILVLGVGLAWLWLQILLRSSL